MSEKWPGIIQEPLTVVIANGDEQKTVVRDALDRVICECKFAPDAYFIAAQLTQSLKAETKRQQGLAYRFRSCYVAPLMAWLRYR